jgi:dGTPase
MITHATTQFIENQKHIVNLSHAEQLIDNSELCNCLKKMARDFAFGNSEVLFEEAKGRKAIEELLDDFWHAISDRKTFDDLRSKRHSARGKFVYSLLSPNYLEEAFAPPQGTLDVANTIRYRELRLLTDMVSGMTDSFAIAMRDKIRSAC